MWGKRVNRLKLKYLRIVPDIGFSIYLMHTCHKAIRAGSSDHKVKQLNTLIVSLCSDRQEFSYDSADKALVEGNCTCCLWNGSRWQHIDIACSDGDNDVLNWEAMGSMAFIDHTLGMLGWHDQWDTVMPSQHRRRCHGDDDGQWREEAEMVP